MLICVIERSPDVSVVIRDVIPIINGLGDKGVHGAAVNAIVGGQKSTLIF